MKHIEIILILMLAVIVFTPAAADTNEPAELVDLRQKWQEAKRRATQPLDLKYKVALMDMKDRLTRAGKLNEALTIANEIKKLEAAALDEEVSQELKIISAYYEEVDGSRRINSTDILRAAFESQLPGLRLNTKVGAGGQDPAPSRLKQTVITYSIQGERKTKKFPESFDLDFKRDLN